VNWQSALKHFTLLYNDFIVNIYIQLDWEQDLIAVGEIYRCAINNYLIIIIIPNRDIISTQFISFTPPPLFF
jgi:hypothetical protein